MGATFDAESCYALVDGVEGIFCELVRISPLAAPGSEGMARTDQFEPACRCEELSVPVSQESGMDRAYLGENVVRENEYLSAMMSVSKESRYGSLFRRSLGVGGGVWWCSKLICIVVRGAPKFQTAGTGSCASAGT